MGLYLVCQKALWNCCIFLFAKRRVVCLCPQKEEGRFAEARNPRQAKLLPVNHGCDKDWCLWAEGAAGTWLKEERTSACFAQRRCRWKTSIILLHYLQSSLPNFGLRKKRGNCARSGNTNQPGLILCSLRPKKPPHIHRKHLFRI